MTNSNTDEQLTRLLHLAASGDEDARHAVTRELLRRGYGTEGLTVEQKARAFAAGFKGIPAEGWFWNAPYSNLIYATTSPEAELIIHSLPGGYTLSIAWRHHVVRSPSLEHGFEVCVMDLAKTIKDAHYLGAGPQILGLYHLFYYLTGSDEEATRRANACI